jgi:hypothetical protein
MSSNRCVNEDVVAQRVATNLRHKARTGEYCDFGQLVLLVLQPEPSPKFYIMDGQHRFATMRRLHQLDPTHPVSLHAVFTLFSRCSHPVFTLQR